MIQSTFVHLPGIGPDTEARLWAAGCHHWDDFAALAPEVLGPTRAARLIESLCESSAAYQELKLSYFHDRLKGGEKWRLASDVLNRDRGAEIAYLDIETTGLGFPPQSRSTTIAVYWGGELFVEHDLARKRALVERLDREATLLVTFNGTTFDLPFLRREFGLALAQAHLDIRFWFNRLGHRGGLKRLQAGFPEVHQRGSMDIDGYDAVRLWRLHQRGVPNALETLKTYNAEDSIVLESLLHLGLRLENEHRPHPRLQCFEAPRPPRIPFEVCEVVYRLLR